MSHKRQKGALMDLPLALVSVILGNLSRGDAIGSCRRVCKPWQTVKSACRVIEWGKANAIHPWFQPQAVRVLALPLQFVDLGLFEQLNSLVILHDKHDALLSAALEHLPHLRYLEYGAVLSSTRLAEAIAQSSVQELVVDGIDKHATCLGERLQSLDMRNDRKGDCTLLFICSSPSFRMLRKLAYPSEVCKELAGLARLVNLVDLKLVHLDVTAAETLAEAVPRLRHLAVERTWRHHALQAILAALAPLSSLLFFSAEGKFFTSEHRRSDDHPHQQPPKLPAPPNLRALCVELGSKGHLRLTPSALEHVVFTGQVEFAGNVTLRTLDVSRVSPEELTRAPRTLEKLRVVHCAPLGFYNLAHLDRLWRVHIASTDSACEFAVLCTIPNLQELLFTPTIRPLDFAAVIQLVKLVKLRIDQCYLLDAFSYTLLERLPLLRVFSTATTRADMIEALANNTTLQEVHLRMWSDIAAVAAAARLAQQPQLRVLALPREDVAEVRAVAPSHVAVIGANEAGGRFPFWNQEDELEARCCPWLQCV